jgi:uncharacterized protein DUF6492
MRADIVIASYKKDLVWLAYCLQFLSKNWREKDSKFIVRLDQDCRDIVEAWPNVDLRVKFLYVKPWPDGYHFQQYLKMTSDLVSNAEVIICVDSDVICWNPASLSDLFEDGLPAIYYLDWGEADPVSYMKWRASTSQIMGTDLDHDYLVAVPFTFWRDTFALTRKRIMEVSGKSFEETVYSDRPYDYRNFLSHPMLYSDYNALSLYAAKYQPSRYTVRPRPSFKNWPFRLYWSHGYNAGIGQELDARLREL